MVSWGHHLADVVQWANGTERSGPVEVEATATFPPADGLWNVPLEFDVRYRYANGVDLQYTTAVCTTMKVTPPCGRGGLGGGVTKTSTMADGESWGRSVVKRCQRFPSRPNARPMVGRWHQVRSAQR